MQAPSLLAASLIALGCARREPRPPAVSAEPLAFVKAAPRVGRIAVEEHAIDFRLDTEATTPSGASTRAKTRSEQKERRREENLAVFDKIVTKKRITYERIEHSETRNGSPVADAPSPLVGRSYVAELREAALVFTGARGEPVSNAEQKELLRRLRRFGKPDPFLEGLPDGPISPGWPASGIAGGFLEIFEPADELRPEGPDVASVGVRDDPQGRCGVFTFTINVQMAGEPRLDLELKGEFLVRASDSAPISLEVRGPARLSGSQIFEGVNVQMSGSGEMNGALHITYF
jgi:hypothetical protein